MICSVVHLPALNPACSSAIISLAWGFKPVQDEFQYNFARMNDEADKITNDKIIAIWAVYYKNCPRGKV